MFVLKAVKFTEYLILIRIKMKIYFVISLTMLITIISISSSMGQNSTTVSASCGSCRKEVSSNSKIGDTCPHCGVRWGKENINTTTTIEKPVKQKEYSGINPFLLDSSPRQSINENTTTKLPEYKLPEYSFQYEETNTIKICKLRSAPNYNSVILGFLPKNSRVRIIKTKGEWVKISYIGELNNVVNSYTGWLLSSNIVE